MQRLTSSSAPFSIAANNPVDTRRFMSTSAHHFTKQRRSSLMAHKDKLWSFCTFCHPQAARPMTCVDKLWSSAHLFPSRDDLVWWHAKTNYGNSAPFVIQRRRARWHAEKNYGHSEHLFIIQTQSCPMVRRDKLWSFCALCHSGAVTRVINA